MTDSVAGALALALVLSDSSGSQTAATSPSVRATGRGLPHHQLAAAGTMNWPLTTMYPRHVGTTFRSRVGWRCCTACTTTIDLKDAPHE